MSHVPFEGILDNYTILEVAPDCTAAEIRKAFRAKALRWHPDKAGDSPDARRRFQELSDAYEVLGDEESRKRYDAQLASSRARTARMQSQQQQATAPAPAPPRPGPASREQPCGGYPASSASGQAQWQTWWSTPRQQAGQATGSSRHAAHAQQHHPRHSAFPSQAPSHDTSRSSQRSHQRASHQRPSDVHEAYSSSTKKQSYAGHGSAQTYRPTAAEVSAHGASETFRASMSDLTTLATFIHEGTTWLPKVRDVDWCRPPADVKRVQLSFAADFASSRSKGRRGAPMLQLLQTSSCDGLQAAFQAHLDAVAPSPPLQVQFRMQLLNFPGQGELQFTLKLRMEGETKDILQSFTKAWEIAPLRKARDCPLM
eukprot:TRINITY_DN62850_c0_g1_i1.p1 TRINITY_DN62850_c0_g1~~TRINITY_DN62850_c0_g1_i1.p1  ORF type:complete len:370 (-),score=77.09 TRINITY_DN62850_c0_g1_i1:156-1265(-)